MKTRLLALALGLPLVLGTAPGQAQTPTARALTPETWVATDALGRTLPTAGTAPAPRPGKFVGVFYFLWHGQHGKDGPYDNTLTVADPVAHPYGPPGAFHWWGEPAVGYFLADDPWVHRHNLQMLADAHVDVIFFDATNAFTYPTIYSLVCRIASDMRRSGIPAPQVAFITHAGPGKTVTQIYNDFYAKGAYQDLWFRWEGKPLILGDKTGKMDDGSAMAPKVVDFFTWRNSWAWDPGQDKWQWIDKYPQRAGWHDAPNHPEEVPVSVAGHPVDNLGRSYHSDEEWGHGTEPPVDAQYQTPESNRGLQFAQQWERALKIDPQFIFVTGWNEWVAQRFLSGAGGGPGFLGRIAKLGETFFVDNYNEEFSRDIMPMKTTEKGGYGDNYYLQLVAGIRRFKGVRALPVAHGFHAPKSFPAWSGIQPTYWDAVGDTEHRDHDGWGKLHYTDTSGRNDFTSAKVACDAKNIYFYVQTQDALTPHTGLNWMQLLIDADLNPRTGWNGYDFVVNSRVINASMTTLKRLSDGKTWPVHYHAAGSEMVVTLPRALLGLTDTHKTTFDFHWVDNASVGGDPKHIADWWYVGDSAPDGRFNYRYVNVTPR